MHTYESLTHGTPVYVSALHRFGTDGLLLADFSQPRPGDRAADLCSGCGVVALRWHDQGHRGPCDGVEIDREAERPAGPKPGKLPGSSGPYPAGTGRPAPVYTPRAGPV